MQFLVAVTETVAKYYVVEAEDSAHALANAEVNGSYVGQAVDTSINTVDSHKDRDTLLERVNKNYDLHP